MRDDALSSMGVYEEQMEVPPIGPDNPDGNWFHNTSRLLEREQDAKRVIAPERNRSWKVANRNSSPCSTFIISHHED